LRKVNRRLLMERYILNLDPKQHPSTNPLQSEYEPSTFPYPAGFQPASHA
jgi:hypothetical protein